MVLDFSCWVFWFCCYELKFNTHTESTWYFFCCFPFQLFILTILLFIPAIHVHTVSRTLQYLWYLHYSCRSLFQCLWLLSKIYDWHYVLVITESLQNFLLNIIYISNLAKLYLFLLSQLQSGLSHPKHMNFVYDETWLTGSEEEELQAVNHRVSTLHYLCLQMRLCYHWYSKVQPDT